MLGQYIFVPVSVLVIHSFKLLLASAPALVIMTHNGRDFNMQEDQITMWVINHTLGTKHKL